MRRTIGVDLTADVRLGRELVAAGGVFAPGATGQLDDECNLVLRAGQEELHLVARIVMINENGVGLEVSGRTPELREQIAAFARIAEHLAATRTTRPPPMRKGDIIERVRRVRYESEDDSPARLAVGSVPPETTLVPAPPLVAPARPRAPEVPVAYAPTQQAEALEDSVLAAKRAAKLPDDE